MLPEEDLTNTIYWLHEVLEGEHNKEHIHYSDPNYKNEEFNIGNRMAEIGLVIAAITSTKTYKDCLIY